MSLRARLPLLHISTSSHLQGDDAEPGPKGWALLVRGLSGPPSSTGDVGAEEERDLRRFGNIRVAMDNSSSISS